MDENKNARRGGRAKKTVHQQDSGPGQGRQAPRLPRLDAIKAAISPEEFYRRELPEVKAWTTKPDGWLRHHFHCIFHDDSNPSAGVNLKTGAYHCFACTADCGDVIDFTKLRDRLDLDGARAALAERYGIRADATPGTPPARPRKARPEPVPTPATSPKSSPGTLTPIPPEALASRPQAHYKHGAPSVTRTYTDAEGRTLAYVLRFDPKGERKQFAPLTWTKAGGWQWKDPPEPLPLYRLDALATRPEAPVLLCEGEKSADDAAILLPDCVVTTTMHGSGAAKKSDFSPLAGRRVWIWPDNDKSGASYAAEVAALARAAGAASVEVLNLTSLARDPKTGEPRALPPKWDAADALAEGWTAEALAAAARWVRAAESDPGEPGSRTPQARPEGSDTDGPPHPYERHPGGIYYRRPPGGRGGDEVPPLWVCPPLRAVATIRDQTGGEFGRLVEFGDLDGVPRREVIADRDRQGSGDALRGRLAALGFEVASHPEARRLFLDLLRLWVPAPRARSVVRTGWTDDGAAYVLPDRVIGAGAEPVILAAEGERPAYGCRGTLDEWRRNLGRLCIGNSRLLFCASAAFAAALLRMVEAESGGFHLKGSSTNASSTGKTTAQRVAVSVCGGPRFLERWRTTDNGLELTAELHNDAALVLDDLNDEITPQAAAATLYMLAGGTGKVRMDRSAGARPVRRWRTLFLSSGEFGIRELMATIQRQAKAGHAVRMVEIPADAGAGLGVFEDLHGYPDGAAFALALTDAAASCYGAAFVAFVEALIRERATLPATVKRLRDAFVANALDNMKDPSGQVRRVALRFGLVAVAGELATAEGITGWPEGAARDAAVRCFGDWLGARGGSGAAEERELIGQVRYFLEAHSNRFRWKNRALDDHAPEVPKQCGFKELAEDGTAGIRFYVFSETFAREVVNGYDPKDAARVLARHGILDAEGEGHLTRQVRLPGFAGKPRVYVLRADSPADEDRDAG